MNKQPTPPTDRRIKYRPIRRVLLGRLCLRWVILVATAVAFVFLCRTAAPHCDNTENAIMLLMSTGIYLFIFWKSRLIPRTFAREWTGTVIEREAKKSIKMPKGVARPHDMHWTMICKWTLRLDPTPRQAREGDEGDVESLTYDTEEIWERYFDIGERVRLYKNARYLVKAHPPRDDENLICPLCGLLVMEPKCPHCRVDFTEPEPK